MEAVRLVARNGEAVARGAREIAALVGRASTAACKKGVTLSATERDIIFLDK